MNQKAKKNSAIQCLKCNDIIVSKYRHDFRFCKCRAVAIDGGTDYLRCIGNKENYRIVSSFGDDDLMVSLETLEVALHHPLGPLMVYIK